MDEENEEVIADLTADMGFKKTFANEEEKEPLITMLNVFLAWKLTHPIVDGKCRLASRCISSKECFTTHAWP